MNISRRPAFAKAMARQAHAVRQAHGKGTPFDQLRAGRIDRSRGSRQAGLAVCFLSLTELSENTEFLFLAWFFEKENPDQQLSPAFGGN